MPTLNMWVQVQQHMHAENTCFLKPEVRADGIYLHLHHEKDGPSQSSLKLPDNIKELDNGYEWHVVHQLRERGLSCGPIPDHGFQVTRPA